MGKIGKSQDAKHQGYANGAERVNAADDGAGNQHLVDEKDQFVHQTLPAKETLCNAGVVEQVLPTIGKQVLATR